ncbi:MAG TPA: type II secretion system minor pseudopilin GspK [Gammaproteobacteria bacterium]|nr:type II secretion system minor pseudopilin GspK [Gammaproteobacteria bacterium]
MARILYKHRQRGVALITALLIVALATAAAAWLTSTHQLSIRRSGNLINGDQAYEYALGMEMIAMIILQEDYKESQKNNSFTDGFSDIWAVDVPPFPVEGGVVTGRVIDLQGLFNLNSLYKNGNVDPETSMRFQRLLSYFELDQGLIDAVIDWVDPDVTVKSSFGAEDDFYAGLEKPYRPANRPFASVSELRMVRGFDVEQFDLLSKVLTVLPAATSINVNTAPMEVQIALGVDPAMAEALDQNPDRDPEPTTNPAGTADPQTQAKKQRMIAEFESIDDYIKAANNPRVKKEGLAVTSSYFLVESEARIDRGYCLLKSILYRDNSGNIRVVMRTQGTL